MHTNQTQKNAARDAGHPDKKTHRHQKKHCRTHCWTSGQLTLKEETHAARQCDICHRIEYAEHGQWMLAMTAEVMK